MLFLAQRRPQWVSGAENFFGGCLDHVLSNGQLEIEFGAGAIFTILFRYSLQKNCCRENRLPRLLPDLKMQTRMVVKTKIQKKKTKLYTYISNRQIQIEHRLNFIQKIFRQWKIFVFEKGTYFSPTQAKLNKFYIKNRKRIFYESG